MVTIWSPFGHRACGHRFLKDSDHVQKLIIHTLLKSRLPHKDQQRENIQPLQTKALRRIINTKKPQV